MNQKLENLSDKNLERLISERDKEFRAIAKFALRVLEKVGNKRDVLDYSIEDFHGFNIHYKNWGTFSGVMPIGATTSLYICYGSVGGLAMEYRDRKKYIPCSDKLLQAIIFYRDDGTPVVAEPYHKGPWENKLKELMANPTKAIGNYLQMKEAARVEALQKKPEVLNPQKVDRDYLLHRAKSLKIN